ncbi:MAG: hypothetical protein CSA75_01580 [Sorangium cellulosum]|nr:MAG: hypothetical protein CSA75_01580 [Sorangium cellulosum]
MSRSASPESEVDHFFVHPGLGGRQPSLWLTLVDPAKEDPAKEDPAKEDPAKEDPAKELTFNNQ